MIFLNSMTFRQTFRARIFSENIGVELFGIDAASFTAQYFFFSQKDCESAPTDGIHAKLGNLIEQTDDIHNFQSVYDKLKDTTNKMTPKEKPVR